MIVIRVELHSARTGQVMEIARAHIINDGTGDSVRRNYILKTFRGRSKTELDKEIVSKQGRLTRYPSERFHVWNLVRFALAAMGYTNG